MQTTRKEEVEGAPRGKKEMGNRVGRYWVNTMTYMGINIVPKPLDSGNNFQSFIFYY